MASPAGQWRAVIVCTVLMQTETGQDQRVESQADPAVIEEVTPETPVEEEPHKFFIIAGSFQNLKNASDLQDRLKGMGYPAEVIVTENRMYRVSVSSYATKEEAERDLAGIKSEPGLDACWLLSN